VSPSNSLKSSEVVQILRAEEEGGLPGILLEQVLDSLTVMNVPVHDQDPETDRHTHTEHQVNRKVKNKNQGY